MTGQILALHGGGPGVMPQTIALATIYGDHVDRCEVLADFAMPTGHLVGRILACGAVEVHRLRDLMIRCFAYGRLHGVASRSSPLSRAAKLTSEMDLTSAKEMHAPRNELDDYFGGTAYLPGCAPAQQLSGARGTGYERPMTIAATEALGDGASCASAAANGLTVQPANCPAKFDNLPSTGHQLRGKQNVGPCRIIHAFG